MRRYWLFDDIGNPCLIGTRLASRSSPRIQTRPGIVSFLLSYLWLGGSGAFADPEGSSSPPRISAGLWEYRPEGSAFPEPTGYSQCFDEIDTPWSVAAGAACKGFAKESWERAGRRIGKSTSYRWEGREFVAETICTGESPRDVHALTVSGGWSGDFSRRLLVTAGAGAGFGDRTTAVSEADATAQRRRHVGHLVRVSGCPDGMAPGDYCGGPGPDGETSGPQCSNRVKGSQ
jgi:hypothetical protein